MPLVAPTKTATKLGRDAVMVSLDKWTCGSVTMMQVMLISDREKSCAKLPDIYRQVHYRIPRYRSGGLDSVSLDRER